MTDFTTIGGLIAELATHDQEAAVYIDNLPPTALSSYRGYYDQLAVERSDARLYDVTELDEPGHPFELNMAGYGTYSPGSREVKIKSNPAVADLIEALGLADGATFEGYKGGQFTMWRDTDLWVSEYGQCDQLRITSVEALDGRVDFRTTKEEW